MNPPFDNLLSGFDFFLFVYLLIKSCFLLVPDIKKYKITFEDAKVKTRPEQQIKYNGTPYIISGQKIYECEFGVDRNITTKKRLLDLKAVEMLRKVTQIFLCLPGMIRWWYFHLLN